MSYRVEIYHAMSAAGQHYWAYRLMAGGRAPMAQSVAHYETERACKVAVTAFFRAARMAEAANA